MQRRLGGIRYFIYSDHKLNRTAIALLNGIWSIIKKNFIFFHESKFFFEVMFHYKNYVIIVQCSSLLRPPKGA